MVVPESCEGRREATHWSSRIGARPTLDGGSGARSSRSAAALQGIMEQQPSALPSTEELQAYSLGKLEPQRAAQIEAFLMAGPDCGAILEAAPEDTLFRH